MLTIMLCILLKIYARLNQNNISKCDIKSLVNYPREAWTKAIRFSGIIPNLAYDYEFRSQI